MLNRHLHFHELNRYSVQDKGKAECRLPGIADLLGFDNDNPAGKKSNSESPENDLTTAVDEHVALDLINRIIIHFECSNAGGSLLDDCREYVQHFST